MNSIPIIVFDFETAGKQAVNPNLCYPIQIAALAIDPRKLEPIPDGTFSSMMCPDTVTEEEWATADQDWKGALDVNKKKVPDIKAAPSEGQVWKEFARFVNKFNPKGSQYEAPIAAGQNSDRFDMVIANRLNLKHKIPQKDGKPLLFSDRTSIDLKNILFMWFEGSNELQSYSMKHIRPFFGISEENAHDAAGDVNDTANLIIRFLNAHRKLYPTMKFKGSFSR